MLRGHHWVVAVAPAVIVKVSEPEPPVNVPGIEQVTLVSELATEQAKVTFEVKPLIGVTVICVALEPPAVKARLAGFPPRVKFGTP